MVDAPEAEAVEKVDVPGVEVVDGPVAEDVEKVDVAAAQSEVLEPLNTNYSEVPNEQLISKVETGKDNLMSQIIKTEGAYPTHPSGDAGVILTDGPGAI